VNEDPRFKVMEVKCFHGQCYGARCAVCNQWLTKHDWDLEEAARNAVDALERKDRWQHVCPGPKT
jgi:hypothetical protein